MPKNEIVRLYLGNSFDVTAREKQPAYVQEGCTSEQFLPDRALQRQTEGARRADRRVDARHVADSRGEPSWQQVISFDSRLARSRPAGRTFDAWLTAHVKWC
jgi:hypothetical protein